VQNRVWRIQTAAVKCEALIVYEMFQSNSVTSTLKSSRNVLTST